MGNVKKTFTFGFKLMTDDELADSEHLSCILEVDLEYPEDLHDLHNDYPVAPERAKIRNLEKLIPNQNNKTNYIVHYENLQLCEGLGLKITKMNRGIKFQESAWMEEYKLGTKAKQSGNNFEIDFSKLMNNSVF